MSENSETDPINNETIEMVTISDIWQLSAKVGAIKSLLEETMLSLMNSDVLKESQVEDIFNNVKTLYISKFAEKRSLSKSEPDSDMINLMLNEHRNEVRNVLTEMRKKLLPNSEDKF